MVTDTVVDHADFHYVLERMTKREAALYRVDDPRDYFSMHDARQEHTPLIERVYFRRGDEGIPVKVNLESRAIGKARRRSGK
jgi:hypothetical protein